MTRQLDLNSVVFRLLLDEGVPADVGRTFEAHGHLVVPFDEVVQRGSPDTLVGRAAEANEAILVAFDKDMKCRSLDLI